MSKPEHMDFLVIGAGRSGTTSLFYLMKQHPDVFIPPQKEVPIGDMPVDEYMRTHFSPANSRVKGTITPQYMAYPGYAEKLHGYWPSAKVIALLRHPVERARSHHQQRSRRGHEPHSFERRFEPGRRYWDRSLYGERLKPYFDLYGNVLVLYTEHLKADPYALMQQIHEFLCLPFFEPKDLYVYHNAGRARPSIFHAVQKILKKMPLKELFPKRFRGRLWYFLEMFRSQQDRATTEAADELPRAFVEDAELIRKMTGEYPPWIIDKLKKADS